MSTASRSRRAGMTLGGLAAGLLLAALALWVGLRMVRNAEIRTAVRSTLGLSDEAFRLERVDPQGTLWIRLRDVALLDRAGDTIVAAPTVRVGFDPRSLGGDGPLVFSRVEVREPVLRLVQNRAGEWNVAQITAVQAAGEDVRVADDDDPGRGILLRDIRIAGGRGTIVTPAEAPLDASELPPGLVRVAAGWVQRRGVTDLDARLPELRFGGDQGWSAEIGTLTANLQNPDVRVVQLRGSVEQAGEDGVRFAIERFQTPNSLLEGGGTAVFADDATRLDLQLRASPLDFRDLQGLGLAALPDEGTATFVLDADTRPDGRTALAFRDAAVQSLGSRATGRLTVLVGGDEPPAFAVTRVALDPLDLLTLERLGLAEELPVVGEVRGTLASPEGAEVGPRAGTLVLDLSAELRPRGAPSAAPSVLTARGPVGFGPDDAEFRFEGVRIEGDPLRLATFAALAPERAELLRGTVRGGATLTGALGAFRLAGGDFAYEVGGAPPTRLGGVVAVVTLDPLRYTVSGRAEPLALATLTELFPALPFRAATLTGPISVDGSAEGFRFDTDLQGAAGGLALRGSVALGEIPRFDVSGRVEAFRAGALLASGAPLEGPVTGAISAAGTTRDFRFDVDLAQAAGTFVLGGRVRMGEPSPEVQVAGRVENFRLGTLLGRPGLVADPLSGRLELAGGGGAAYRFDTDLRGGESIVQLRGFYAPGVIPQYAVSGTIQGVNLRAFPALGGLPQTRFAATIDVEGRGTTPETLAGRFNVSARALYPRGGPIDVVELRAVAEGGVLRVENATASLPGIRFAASGALGLVRPAPEPLRFTVQASDLSQLAAVLPPPGLLEPAIAGALSAQGTVTGTLRAPTVAVGARGQRLRYQDWEAATLVLQGRASQLAGEWSGQGTLAADGATAPTVGTLEAVRLEGTLVGGIGSFAARVRRDAQTELAVAGAVALEGPGVRQLALDSLALRLPGSSWRLTDPSTIRWTDTEGLRVSALLLRREGDAPGTIEVDGILPLSGVADLRVRAEGLELAELRQLSDALPDVAGTAYVDAVLRGSVERPELQALVRVDSLKLGGVATDRVSAGLRYAERRMEVDASAQLQGRDILSAEALFPMLLRLDGGIPRFEVLRAEPVRAQLLADGFPLQLVAAATPGLREGQGFASAEVQLGGTPETLQVSGQAAVSGGVLFVEALGVPLTDIQARISLAEQRIRIDTLTVRSGGVAQVAGVIGVADSQNPDVQLNATFQEFRAINRPDLADLTASGQLALVGRLPAAGLTGRVQVNRGRITIPRLTDDRELEIVGADVGQLGADTIPFGADIATSPFGPLRIDALDLVLGDDVWAQNPDVRVQIDGALQVYSVGGAVPRVFGRLRTVRGTYGLRIQQIVRDFEVEQGTIEFFGTPELNPSLDVTAVNEVRTAGVGTSDAVRILVRVTGNLESPEINLTSDTRPPLPESELLSLLIFGQPSVGLGTLPGQLAQQLLFQEIIGGQVAAFLERQVGGLGLFDYVRFRTRPVGGFGGLGAGRTNPLDAAVGTFGLGTASVEAGRRVFRNVFLTVETGVGALVGGDEPLNFGAGVEWQIDDQWSVRAALEPVRQGLLSRIFQPDLRRQWALDVRRRWEFGLAAEDPDVPLPGSPQLRLSGQAAPALPEEEASEQRPGPR